jgi:hypothetical protein
MAKTNKDKQCNAKHIEERQTIPWPKTTRKNNVIYMVLSDVHRCVLYNIVFPCCFWPWYCLTFFDVFSITLFVLVGFGHGIVLRSSISHRRTSDNTMTKTIKDKQCYTKHMEERQTIPWPKPTRTNNVIQNTSKKVRQYHGQNQQGQTMLYKTHQRT